MPRFRGIVSEIDQGGSFVAGRQAVGADFGGDGAARVGAAVQSAGQDAGTIYQIVQQHKARKEVTAVDIGMVQANADLTIDLQNRVRAWKPGDPDLMETFPGVVRDRLNQVGFDRDGGSLFESSAASQHFERKAAMLASQFTVESGKAQATLDGHQAVADHAVLLDKSSNLVSTYPTYFESTRQDIHDAVNNPEGVYSRISHQDREKLLRKSDELLATSAVYGLIRQAPKNARELLANGWMREFIPGEKMPSIMAHADTAVHALDVEARQNAEAQRQLARDTSHHIDIQLSSQHAAHKANPSHPEVTPTVILNAVEKGLDGPTARTWLNMLDMEARQGDKPIRTDRAEENDLFRRIHLPPGHQDKIIDTGPIYTAFLSNKLSPESRRDLVKELTDARDERGQKIGLTINEFLETRKSSITHANQLLGKLDSEGDTKFGDFRYFVRERIAQYEKEGKDPQDLFNPAKPDFLGKPEIMKPYLKTMQQSIKTVAEKFKKNSAPEQLPAEQQRRPGESFGEWKARQK